MSQAFETRALIDIGTNSVKLLVADVAGKVVRPIHEISEQTRLGRGFYETHVLQPEAIRDTVRVLREFRSLASQYGVVSLRVVATSAVRDARNQSEFLQAAHLGARVNVEVIPGDQEADWVYQGVMSDPSLLGQRLLILDVGGGSSEFILGEGEHKQFRESFPLGSVRSLEQLQPQDPPLASDLPRCREELGRFVQEKVKPRIRTALDLSTNPARLVGTGGASTIMGRILLGLESFERERLDGAQLPFNEVTALVERLWSMPLNDRKQIVGLPKKRADVILTGAVIYEQVMSVLGFDVMSVSTRGLRFGGILVGRRALDQQG